MYVCLGCFECSNVLDPIKSEHQSFSILFFSFLV